MKDSGVVLLYGNTCSGKSTLGKQLEETLGAKYLSFGDLKRAEIRAGTTEGKALDVVIRAGKPIDPVLGAQILQPHFGSALNCLSGYPISLEELAAFQSHCHLEILALILLDISTEQALRRFALRATCPVCQYPGRLYDVCPVHKVLLGRREDSTEMELLNRFRLFEQRILPFFKSSEMSSHPRLSLSVTTLSREAVLQRVIHFLGEI